MKSIDLELVLTPDSSAGPGVASALAAPHVDIGLLGQLTKDLF